MAKGKKDAALAPVVAKPLKKEAYKAKLNIPAGSPDRHIVRIANKTWLMVQPGGATFLGQFPSKDEALVMANRHVEVTKGNIVCHN